MNSKLEELLKKAQYYTPAKTVDLDAAGGSAPSKTIEFTGLNGQLYGVNRILTGGKNLSAVKATVAFNNGRNKVFEDVQLSALRKLFVSRTLRGAIPIDRGTKVLITLENTDSSAQTVNVELIGYDDAHLQQKQESYSCNDVKFPEPEFVYITETIASGSGQQRFSVNLPAYKLRLYRMAASTSGDDDNIKLSVRQDKTRIKPEVYLSQVNDEFRNKDIILPQTLQAHTPFDLFVTNTGSSDQEVSFIAECYKL